jgi:hypothetical protein
MCTVTFMPRKNGYCLGMNRDEKLARPQGLPPKLKVVKNRRVICPSEPGGGTWIALNDFGVSLALINWYSVPKRVKDSPTSRGEVVKAACAVENPRTMQAVLSALPLERINPFRLIAVFPAVGQIMEYRWELKNLGLNKCDWQPQQWISSGFDERAAQRERNRTFRQALAQKSAGRLTWLRRLHSSHAPQKGPFSTCMHRLDAATVSYTEAVVSGREVRLSHCLGAPCEPLREFTLRITNGCADHSYRSYERGKRLLRCSFVTS